MARQDSIGPVKSPSLDELVLLPEPLAVQRHFDARNYRFFRFLLALDLLLFLPAIAEALQRSRYVVAAVHIAGLLLTMALIVARQSEVYETWFRQILLAYLFYCIVASRLAGLGTKDGVMPLFILLPMLFMVFRLRVSEELMLFGGCWLIAMLPLGPNGWLSADALLPTGTVIGITVATTAFLALAILFNQLGKRRFLTGWRRENTRARERARMREEIETARRIQLSMLPQASPDVDWIELAAASLPANEVGGDYYEHFRLSPEQLAVVIGDVAGHGLASGLLLSGVRSCLYLLEGKLSAPVEVLELLNHMVQRTTDKRTYVTLLCAWIERRGGSGRLCLASAGHPPVLHYCAHSGLFEEVGSGALPLGTHLDARFEEQSCAVSPHDVLVFYTDGLVEARNDQGVDYGDARLQRAVARAAGASAREIRDSILGDLANFKGDAEQSDDITVVVARIK
jgi:Stage II sporulation protein E (SpoIIE)